MVQRLVWRAAITIAPALPGRREGLSTRQALQSWVVRHWEGILVAALLLVVALAHGINMFHFPYFEDDEGTYMAQAWAVVHEGNLAPYTYFYDHAPGGWILIALWTVLTGGFHTFGMADQSGRVLMLVLQVGSAFMLYRIARSLTKSVPLAVLAVLLFSLGAYGIYFQRRVLLDNITTFWMLLSILLLVEGRLSLRKVWGSALALAISILSKEVTGFLIPAMAYLAYTRSHKSHRTFAMAGWLGILIAGLSLYLLMAVIKGELFATGTLLGGTANHVSLLGTLKMEAMRGDNGTILNPHSGFWQQAHGWARDEPLLTVAGSFCAIFSVLLIRRQRLIGIMGLLSLSLWAFMARGGVVIEFYFLPLLPLLALNVVLVLGLAIKGLRLLVARFGGLGRTLVGSAYAVGFVLCLGGLAIGYRSPVRGFQGDPLVLWKSTQADAQVQAFNWIEKNIPAGSKIIIDNYLWTDLRDGYGGRSYLRADYYWKVDDDPAIKGKDYDHGNWRAADWVVETIQMDVDAKASHLNVTAAAIKHSVVEKHFDTGGWPINIRRVENASYYASLPHYWYGVCVSGCGQRSAANGRPAGASNGTTAVPAGQAAAVARRHQTARGTAS